VDAAADPDGRQLHLRLRHKLEPDLKNPIYIRKAYGDGYRLVTSE